MTTQAAPVALATAGCGWDDGIGWYCGFSKGSADTHYGDRGDKVAEVQALVKNTSGYGGELAVDGVFGKDTLVAVKWFQKTYLGPKEADGTVGPKTWEALRGM